MLSSTKKLGVWFPTVRCGTGTDVFTINLVEELNKRGIRAEITWLPLRAEYAPWSVPIPKPPNWATVIHVNTWLHSRFLPKNIPIVATIHHSIHDPELQPYKGFLRTQYHNYWIKNIERKTMQRANKVTAVSQFAALIAHQKVINIPIEVIYNGVDTDLFKLSNQLKEKEAPFRLLYIGSWMARKGVDLLTPIMKELGNDFELYYTGGEAAAKDRYKMPKNMHDLGRLDKAQVINAMQEADALLFTSRSEGLPLTVLEAMACGLPVITTNGSALPEVIQHRETGFLCDKNNIQSFVEAIRILKETSRLQKELSLNARSYIEDNFKIDKMIKLYIEAYQALH
ncbi:glycosyltransferase family 4 protein [Acinetobacter sp. YH12058]|uniref:glycosyltransferase family 4 protein n=1 Tax=Acinetobacter sp. YH12058 TaxID=2601058 RepID=UPI0015D289F8|nr:glycosyltransferase family 4 protein [Acinetobacter sp. YH12058]